MNVVTQLTQFVGRDVIGVYTSFADDKRNDVESLQYCARQTGLRRHNACRKRAETGQMQTTLQLPVTMSVHSRPAHTGD